MSHRPKKKAVNYPSYQASSDELYQALFDQAADSIFIANPQGRCIEINRCGCKMLGYTREELWGLSMEDLAPAEDLARDPLQYEMSRTSVALNVLAQEIIRELAPETQNRTVRWCVADLPTVSGDQAMLRQVLTNLLSNALKFTSVGGVGAYRGRFFRDVGKSQTSVGEQASLPLAGGGLEGVEWPHFTAKGLVQDDFSPLNPPAGGTLNKPTPKRGAKSLPIFRPKSLSSRLWGVPLAMHPR